MENRHLLTTRSKSKAQKAEIHALLPLFLVIVLAAVLRFLPHVPNVTPIAAMALFGGAYLPKRFALTVPLLAMLFSDMVLGFSLVTPFIYGSFIIAGFLGMLLRKQKSPLPILVASLAASTLFFLITNFGVFVEGILYPHTFSGLLDAYIMGLPFFRNTLIGDLAYTTLFFGGFEVMRLFVSKYLPQFSR